MTDLSYNEQDTLRKVAEGDEAAFRALFDHFSPKIRAFAINLTHSDYLAEEIIQEVFSNIWINRQQLTRVLSIEAWLITIAKNTGSNLLRRMAHEQLIAKELSSQTSTAEDIGHDLEWKQYHEKLYNAVANLPLQQKKVWIMSRQLGIKQQQIADDLQLSVYTVKEYLKKATITLKKSLKILFLLIPSFFAPVCLPY